MKINENRIATIIGSIMSYSIFKENKNCEMLKQENKMMQNMLY